MTTRLYGVHAVTAALRHEPEQLVKLFVGAKRRDQRMQEIVALAQRHRIAVERCDARDFPAHSQQVIAIVQASVPAAELWGWLSAAPADCLLLVLDRVQDPQNLGSALRSAEAAGVAAVIVPERHAAGLTEVARKVSCGAAMRLPFFVVGNLALTLRRLKEEAVFLLGASAEVSNSLYDCALPVGRLALVLGGEHRGMRRLTAELCDTVAALPMAAGESLNVAVAAAVFLFELRRRRSLQSPPQGL